jgi:hypothetical protein
MPRFRQRSYALMLIAAGLASCGTAPGFDNSGLRATVGSAAYSHEQAKLSSKPFGAVEARSELASAAEPMATEAKKAGQAKHSSRATKGRRGLDGLRASKQGAGAEVLTDGAQRNEKMGEVAPRPAAFVAIDTGARPSWMNKKTPIQGSPEWKQEQQETEKQEQEIQRVLGGICHGC